VPCWHAVDRDDKQVWEMAGHKDMAVIAMSGSLLFAWMCVDELSDKMHLFLRLRHAFEGRLCVSAQIELICPLRVPDASRRLMCKWLGSGRIGMTPVVLVSALLSQCAHAQQTQGRTVVRTACLHIMIVILSESIYCLFVDPTAPTKSQQFLLPWTTHVQL